MMKLRNAYILVYKRKLEDDSDLADVDEQLASTSSAEIVKPKIDHQSKVMNESNNFDHIQT